MAAARKMMNNDRRRGSDDTADAGSLLSTPAHVFVTRHHSSSSSSSSSSSTVAAASPARVAGNTVYLAAASSAGGRALPSAAAMMSAAAPPALSRHHGVVSDDDATFHTLFQDAPVFRSAGPVPAMMSTMTATMPSSATAAAVSSAAALSKAMPVFAASAAAVARSAIVCPALPHPYVLSHQSWTVPAAVPVQSIVEAMTRAFKLMDVDATFFAASAEFKCAATVEFRSLRFTTRLFTSDGTVVEFQLNSGGSMEYHQLYANIIQRLPRKVRATCRNASPRPVSFCPPPLVEEEGEASKPSHLAAGDVAPLVRMAASGMRSLQRDATAALAELSAEPANAPVLVTDGVLASMASLLAATKDWVTVQAAVSVIANVVSCIFSAATATATSTGTTTTSATVNKAVDECGAVVSRMIGEVRQRAQGVVGDDSASQQALRRECCRALAFMTLNSTLGARVAAEGGADALHLASKCHDVRESAYAASAMTRLCACA